MGTEVLRKNVQKMFYAYVDFSEDFSNIEIELVKPPSL